MTSLSLTGKWQFRQAGTDEWLPAWVPGSVHTDLLALGRIPDPFVADNELRVQWVAERDWEYRLAFPVSPDRSAERPYGVPIFAKGANWIPADSFPTRISDAHLEHLIRSAASAHMNMLRVWGGGFYEEDRFYDLCDRYGLLVWQDFVFSCSIYPDDGTFFENVRVEAVENVRRLRHRASLALWCGNNEMEF